jgi:hypothetical protein
MELYMQPMRARLIIIVSTLLSLTSSTLFARTVQVLSYEELVARSDVVAIVQPFDNQPAKDTFPGYSYGHPTTDFVATNTRFEVHVLLKGDGESAEELTVVHFGYATKLTMTSNGANFIRFLVGPLQYEKRAVKLGTPVGGVTTFQQEPLWLAFLKRRDDGRFEPVTGHYDSARSFRELHEPSFFASP